MLNIRCQRLLPLLLTLSAPLGAVASAQEIEPRAYSRAPVGTQYVVVAYAYSSGDVLTDASLPLRDVEVKFGAVSLAYGRAFGLAGRQANVGVLVPYIRGRASGLVFEQLHEVTRSGLGDVRLRFSTSLLGGIDFPTLVVSGSEDTFTPPDEMRALAAAIPRCRLEVIQCGGHVCSYERPAAFNHVVSEFLATLLYD